MTEEIRKLKEIIDGSDNIVFNTCQHTEFAFYGHTVLVGIFNNFLGEGNVFVVGKARTIDHY